MEHPDVEKYAEVGENVQKSMDQALDFQNQPDPAAGNRLHDRQDLPNFIPRHHESRGINPQVSE